MAMTHTRVDDVDHYRFGTGEIFYPPEQGHIITYRVRGYISAEMAHLLFRRYEEHAATAPPPHYGFADYGEVHGYDKQARIDAIQWFKIHKHTLLGFHVLAPSKIVAFGLATAGMISGLNLHTYADAERYERAKAAALAVAGLGRATGTLSAGA